MAGLDPAIPTGSVAAGNGFFRDTGAGGDGRVKPGHDALGQTPTYVSLFTGWCDFGTAGHVIASANFMSGSGTQHPAAHILLVLYVLVLHRRAGVKRNLPRDGMVLVCPADQISRAGT